MRSHPNAEIQRALVEAIVRGDMTAARELLAEDLIVHLPGNNRFAGTYKGRDEFFKLARALNEATGGLHRKLHDVVGSDDHSVALLHLTVERDGKTITWGAANVAHIHHGRVSELWLLTDDPAAADEAFS